MLLLLFFFIINKVLILFLVNWEKFFIKFLIFSIKLVFFKIFKKWILFVEYYFLIINDEKDIKIFVFLNLNSF